MYKKIEKNTQGYRCDVSKVTDAEIVVRTAEKVYSLDSALSVGVVTQAEYDEAVKRFM